MNTENSQLIFAAAGKASRKRLDRKFGRKIGAAALAATIAQFWFAQLICWGLSLYHVSSGIWGPWLIMEALSSLGIAVVAIGMMKAVRDLADISG